MVALGWESGSGPYLQARWRGRGPWGLQSSSRQLERGMHSSLRPGQGQGEHVSGGCASHVMYTPPPPTSTQARFLSVWETPDTPRPQTCFST